MDERHPDWRTAAVTTRVNQLYLTGTMQDGLLVVPRDGDARYFVRRSFTRAQEESPFARMEPMDSYRDIARRMDPDWGVTYLETEIVPYDTVLRLGKYFRMQEIRSLDRTLFDVRAVKSPYELAWMERSGARHHALLREEVPKLLQEGMSEADFVAELYACMVKNGYQGLCRFFRFQTEMVVGQVGFGESSLCPTCFDGPGGAYGMCAAAPLVGSRERKLKIGDLVFVDIAFGMNGYHTDKTQVYSFGKKPSPEAVAAHRLCREVQARAAEMLKPGAIPSHIYRTVCGALTDDQRRHFMGYGDRSVKFLGHGVGLHVDEFPVIAEGFDAPLEENMTLALEPKKGVPGEGMAGVEDTFVVTPAGGRCITGEPMDILVV